MNELVASYLALSPVDATCLHRQSHFSRRSRDAEDVKAKLKKKVPAFIASTHNVVVVVVSTIKPFSVSHQWVFLRSHFTGIVTFVDTLVSSFSAHLFGFVLFFKINYLLIYLVLFFLSCGLIQLTVSSMVSTQLFCAVRSTEARYINNYKKKFVFSVANVIIGFFFSFAYSE